MNNILIKNSVEQLKENQEGSNWFDENFKKKLENIGEVEAFVRPIPEMHSIAELVGHILTWRIEGIKKLQGMKSKVTMDSPENWRSNDKLKKIGWEKLKSDLTDSQNKLMELIGDETDEFLTENDYVPGYSYKFLIDGLIHHDIYHLGQIGMVLKLLKMNLNFKSLVK